MSACRIWDSVDDLKGGGGSWLSAGFSRSSIAVALLPPRDGLAKGEATELLGDGSGSIGAATPIGELSTASRTGSNAGIVSDSEQHSNNLSRQQQDLELAANDDKTVQNLATSHHVSNYGYSLVDVLPNHPVRSPVDRCVLSVLVHCP